MKKLNQTVTLALTLFVTINTSFLKSESLMSVHQANIWTNNQAELRSILDQSPDVADRLQSDVLLEVPTYDGSHEVFRFYETEVMQESLSKRFPNIKSYMGVGINNPSHRSSIVIHSSGIFGLVINNEGRSHLKVLDSELTLHSSEDFSDDHHNCEISQELYQTRDLNNDIFWDCVGSDSPCYPVGSTLTTYRFAGIMSERANNDAADGTVEGGLAWMVSMVNQINLLWVRELGFKLVMVDGSDQLIFTNDNPAPDVFQQDPSCHSSGDPKYCELGEVKPYLESVIGPGGDSTPQNERTWEYGAHFDTRYNGGVAYAPGSTSTNNANYEVFNHEIGHNLGSSHNITIENGWRCSIGGTIMGSRVRTLNGSSGDQYSSHTIELAMNYRNDQMIYQNLGIWAGNYVTGSQEEETGNIIPDLIVPESGFIIPKETPFILEGSSSPYEPSYTFSWEQNDASDESFSMNPTDQQLPFFLPDRGPLFSTVGPTPEGYRRSFPAMESILENNYETEINDYGTMLTVEKLPFASRELNMRLLVRTNDPYAGSFNHKNVQFFVAGTSGPFRVLSQNDSTVWSVGSEQTISWDVANTNDPDSVNCQAVDIYLSLDGGPSFDFLLASSIPNNGSYTFTIPSLPPSNSARLMIRAADNVFFDINNGVINIQNTNTPNVSLLESNLEINLVPNSVGYFSFDIQNNGEVGSVLSYRTDVAMEYMINETFDGQMFPQGWSDTTDAECDNPGWFISSDASSSYFQVPPADGFYIAVNDDACGGNSDGSNDMLFTNTFSLPEGLIEFSFRRFFTGTYGQTLRVLISLDNWENSDELLYLDGWDGNEEWVYETLDITSYAGQDIAIAFHSSDGGGWASGVALDNISIGFTPVWISTEANGYIGYGESESAEFMVNTEGMDLGVYSTSLVVENLQTSENDILGVTLNVTEEVVQVDQDILPSELHLYQNHPNPFNPETSIRFSLPIQQDVSLAIYDMMGREVRMMTLKSAEPGHHVIRWNGKNQNGTVASAGVYFYQLYTPSFSMTKKMILLK